MSRLTLYRACLAAALVLLPACGDGDNEPSPPADYNGTWVGDYTVSLMPGAVYEGVLPPSRNSVRGQTDAVPRPANHSSRHQYGPANHSRNSSALASTAPRSSSLGCTSCAEYPDGHPVSAFTTHEFFQSRAPPIFTHRAGTPRSSALAEELAR